MIRMLPLLLLSACGRSTDGPLDPIEGAGVRIAAAADGDCAAELAAGGVSARPTARWSDTGGQSVLLVYANRGRTPVRIDMSGLGMSSLAGEAVVLSAADVTGTNLLDDRTDNDGARILLQRDGDGLAKGVLDLSPGAERHVDAQLSLFSNDKAAAAGDRMILHVPLPTGRRDVAFVARRPPLLPF